MYIEGGTYIVEHSDKSGRASDCVIRVQGFSPPFVQRFFLELDALTTNTD